MTITPLLASGQAAPGLPGVTLADAFGPRITPEGRVVAWIGLAGSGVTTTNDSAAVLAAPGQATAILLRKGDEVVGFPPLTASAQIGGLPYPNIDGLGRLSVTVARAAVEPDSPTTIAPRLTYRNALLSRWTPGVAPILVDGSFWATGLPRYDGLITTPGGRAISFYDLASDAGDGGGPVAILRRGDAAPGFGDGRVVAGLGAPGVSAAGAIAFRATMNALNTPAGTTPAGTAIYTTLSGALVLVASTSAVPATTDAYVELGAEQSIDDGAGIAFWARTGASAPGGIHEVLERFTGGTVVRLLEVGQSVSTPLGVGTISRIDRRCALLPSGEAVVLIGLALPGDTGGARNAALVRVSGGARGGASMTVIAQKGAWPVPGATTDAVAFFGTYASSGSGRVVYSVRTGGGVGSFSSQVLLTTDARGLSEEIVRTGATIDLVGLGLGSRTVRDVSFEGIAAGTVSGVGAYGQISGAPGGGGSAVFSVQFTDFTTGVLRARVGCRGDFDDDGERSKGDVATFLNAYFAGNLHADTDLSGGLSPRDIFAFLVEYFGGC